MKAIITFHSIDDSGTVLSFPKRKFLNLIQSIIKLNIPILSLDALLHENTTNGITLTFDDGMKSVYTDALPILRDYNAIAHLYLTTGVVGKNNKWPTQPQNAPYFEMLNWNEIEELNKSGVLIESHTNSHPDLRTLGNQELEDECGSADDMIENRLGRRPEYFAYPYGYVNNNVCNFFRNKYKATVTTEFRVINDNEDMAMLPRLDSYYLQPLWLQNNLDSIIAKQYFSFRGWLRTLRGTQ